MAGKSEDDERFRRYQLEDRMALAEQHHEEFAQQYKILQRKLKQLEKIPPLWVSPPEDAP